MNRQTKKEVAHYLRGELLRTRCRLNLSQNQMAMKLGITPRGYRSLEAGESCCALMTVLCFWRYCCLDKPAFLMGLAKILDASPIEDWLE